MTQTRIAAAVWPWGTQTTEQTETALREIAAAGFGAFETVRAAISLYETAAAFVETAARFGVRPVSFYFHLPGPEGESEFFANLDRDLEFVRQTGVRLLTLQASVGRPKAGDAAALEAEIARIRRFARRAADFGLYPGIHNHHNTGMMYAEELDRLFEAVEPEWLGFVPDIAHLILAGCDPVAFVRKHAERIRLVHLKDIAADYAERENPYDAFCELGQGCADFAALSEVLRDAGFDGILCSELDRAPVSDAQSAAANFRFIAARF